MKITINGNEEEIASEMTVRDLLAACNVESPDMVSVEHNGTILNRSEFPTVVVREGDVIEFLYFVGGGSLS
ncbi:MULTISPECIES: sulfur carrier protein ThiS [unclassified Methanoculleus]|jgi:sulfur carrier protein|nr:sulfur carrier protein ThiS [Methanoculleus sp. UBA377]MDD2473646.1 sulfur carrier protein ThiS [Methanoculleus sp.]